MKKSTSDFFIKSRFRDGVGKKRSTVDVYANLALVECGARPAFLLQDCDYSEEHFFRKILEVIWSDRNFETRPTSQGVLVYRRGDLKTEGMVRSLQRAKDKDEAMGLILGYPAARDFPDYRERGRLFFRWYAEMGGHTEEIMTNVFRDRRLMEGMVDLADAFASCLEGYGVSVSYDFGRMR